MSHPKTKTETVKFDSETRKWFDRLPLVDRMTIETTVARCEDCGLYYKPSLGHKCKKSGTSNA